jgi:hypothetical protein
MATATFIIGAKRTAFGAFGGSLKALTATELATKVRARFGRCRRIASLPQPLGSPASPLPGDGRLKLAE